MNGFDYFCPDCRESTAPCPQHSVTTIVVGRLIPAPAEVPEVRIQRELEENARREIHRLGQELEKIQRSEAERVRAIEAENERLKTELTRLRPLVEAAQKALEWIEDVPLQNKRLDFRERLLVRQNICAPLKAALPAPEGG